MNTQQFKENIELAWCRETSSDPENWSKQDPALGQCSPTACLAQDYLDGKIVFCEVFPNNSDMKSGTGVKHYLNEINGEIFDFTREQFSQHSLFSPAIEKKKDFNNTRDFVLSFQDTRKRYLLLKSSFKKVIS